MKAPFSKTWIEGHKRNLEEEFDCFNLDNPRIKWERLRTCNAYYTSSALISYKTFVAVAKWVTGKDGYGVKAVIARDTYSPTTVKHIYAFAREIEADCIIFLNSSKGPYSVAL